MIDALITPQSYTFPSSMIIYLNIELVSNN